MTHKAPFPYAGGKSSIASMIWARFGRPPNYVEPFCGSAAVLLARPDPPQIETINDLDGFICNAYRAIRDDPEGVAYWCAWPVSECDLHARHAWLIAQREDLTRRLEGDPAFSDAKIAGWWIWGASCWIGGGWCSGEGPWHVLDGQLIHLGNAGQGIQQRRPHLGNAGQGIQRLHLGDAGEDASIRTYLTALAARLSRVRITCGAWTRVVTPCVTWQHGVTGIFLDPPYPTSERDWQYAIDDKHVWEDCWTWAMTHGSNPLLRIALCGYTSDRAVPPQWSVTQWKTHGGYGSLAHGRGRANAAREIIYWSPHCLKPLHDLPLFEGFPHLEDASHGVYPPQRDPLAP